MRVSGISAIIIAENGDVRKIISSEREMSSAKKKPPTGASELLRTAAANAVLYSPFQSIVLGKLACCLSALV